MNYLLYNDDMEEELFKKTKFIKEKLLKYGFKKNKNNYIYETDLENNFKAIILIDENMKISGKVYDKLFNDEYLSFKINSQNGDFVGNIRNKYKILLEDILERCTIKNNFIYNQSNRISNKIKEKYNVDPEHLWKDAPYYGVFKNKNNKWFGIIMNVDKSKLNKYEKGEVEIINVKLDDKVNLYLKINGIYESYHMSKKNWVTIIFLL